MVGERRKKRRKSPIYFTHMTNQVIKLNHQQKLFKLIEEETNILVKKLSKVFLQQKIN